MTQTPSSPSETDALWTCVRADYAAGTSTAVLAERYDLADRSIRRRAAVEGWPRDGLAERGVERLRLMRDEQPVSSGFAEIDSRNQQDVFDLLLYPNAPDLSAFAFRRAAECAVMNTPTQALAWMRLVRLSEQMHGRPHMGVEMYSDADYLRAAMIRDVNADMGFGPGESAPESASGQDDAEESDK